MGQFFNFFGVLVIAGLSCALGICEVTKVKVPRVAIAIAIFLASLLAFSGDRMSDVDAARTAERREELSNRNIRDALWRESQRISGEDIKVVVTLTPTRRPVDGPDFPDILDERWQMKLLVGQPDDTHRDRWEIGLDDETLMKSGEARSSAHPRSNSRPPPLAPPDESSILATNRRVRRASPRSPALLVICTI